MPRFNPYKVKEHGWRGLSLPGNHKRKWYTILHNDQVLVTGLLLFPGEGGVRHSHETGELSVHFSDEMRPQVSWNPPGVFHGGTPPVESLLGDSSKPFLTEDMIVGMGGNGELARLISEALKEHLAKVEEAVAERLKPEPAPRIIVDILFPPFKTTIDDPEIGVSKTVVGQWFD